MSVLSEAQADAAVMAAEVVTRTLELRLAERELAEMGVTASPADVQAWLRATPRDKRRFATDWATYLSAGDPAWKKARR